MKRHDEYPTLDILQRCLQHALDLADFLADNHKAISDHMIDTLGDLPPELSDDERREIEQTLLAVERLQHERIMRKCA